MNNFNYEMFIKPYKSFIENNDVGRLRYYEYAIKKLVSLNKPITVVETGTMWNGLDMNQGAFTLIFADLIKNHTGGKLITIDISEEHINLCKKYTEKYSDVIEYVVSDSVTYLSYLSDEEVKNISLLYLDSWDLNMLDPLPSQIHHMRELSSVYHRLSDNVLIAVDDNLMPDCWIEWFPNGTQDEKVMVYSDKTIIGKGTLVDRFLLDNGWTRLPITSTYCLLGYEKI